MAAYGGLRRRLGALYFLAGRHVVLIRYHMVAPYRRRCSGVAGRFKYVRDVNTTMSAASRRDVDPTSQLTDCMDRDSACQTAARTS